jgi:hypothetical protein
LIAANSTAAVSFGDKDAAREVLSAVHVEPSIMGSEIYTPGGENFAAYKRIGAVEPKWVHQMKPGAAVFHDNLLVVVREIRLNDAVIGNVCVWSDLRRLSGTASANRSHRKPHEDCTRNRRRPQLFRPRRRHQP